MNEAFDVEIPQGVRRERGKGGGRRWEKVWKRETGEGQNKKKWRNHEKRRGGVSLKCLKTKLRSL